VGDRVPGGRLKPDFAIGTSVDQVWICPSAKLSVDPCSLIQVCGSLEASCCQL